MNAPAHFSPTVACAAERTRRSGEPYRDAVPIGWLVDARIRQLRQLICAQVDGQESHTFF